MSKNMLRAGVLLLTACALLVGTAVADSIDFSSTASGGTISFLPGFGNSLSVHNANIGQVEFQVPTTTVDPVVGGMLNLVTGGCIHYCTTNTVGSNVNSTDVFANGGYLSITGSIPSLAGDPHGLLFYGVWDVNSGSNSFGHPTPCPATTSLHTNGGQASSFGGCLHITNINTVLLADLGFPTFFTSGQGYLSQMEFDITYSALGGFSGTVASSDLVSDPAVPEPATLALLGAGLLGLGSLGRKKLLGR